MLGGIGRMTGKIQVQTKPMEEYWEIICPLNWENRYKFPHHCYLICGLECAADCSRFPDDMCSRCPCLKAEEELVNKRRQE